MVAARSGVFSQARLNVVGIGAPHRRIWDGEDGRDAIGSAPRRRERHSALDAPMPMPLRRCATSEVALYVPAALHVVRQGLCVLVLKNGG
ncbi:hypothetical protein GCM10010532_076260 [Dactylosporangium siamense]|uniref:Uncharacterized protein n=1 Tax=Dactylosporangium siamense TaxID=685454 RepID=A0A919UA97_9ACTN|nr:hypothetical protein Dsi01nite_058130 [Dactylosporangium siamense]